jgi:dipeptidyl aminopeptidase/acylaminoacyl peptidase
LSHFTLTDRTPQRIDLNGKSAHDLKWTSDDAIISFIVDENSTSSIMLYNVNDPKLEVALTIPLPAQSLKWSGNGGYVGFAVEVYPNKTINETVEIDKEKAKSKSDKMVFDQLFLYHWDTWETGKYFHVMYVKVTKSKTDPCLFTFDKTITDVMTPMDGNCPSKPWGSPPLASLPFSRFFLFCFPLFLPHRWCRRI